MRLERQGLDGSGGGRHAESAQRCDPGCQDRWNDTHVRWSFRGARPITAKGWTPQVTGLELGGSARTRKGLRAGSHRATLLVCAAFRLHLSQNVPGFSVY